MYGQKAKTKSESGAEEGWTLFEAVTGRQRLALDLRAGQLLLVDAAPPNAVRWSVLVRRGGEVAAVESLEGPNVTRLEPEQYRNGIEMSQAVQIRCVGPHHPSERVSIRLHDILLAAKEGREYVDL